MDQGPLVSEQIDAGARFLGEFQKYAPVQAAFWLKDSEEGGWSLYVASDRISDENTDTGYGEVLRIAGRLEEPWFDPFQVKLIGTNDPLAQAVLDMHRRYPGKMPTRFHGKALGGVNVEEGYIYPRPVPSPVPSGG
jgi:hypothetical protein